MTKTKSRLTFETPCKVGNKSEKCTDPNLWEADNKLGDDDPRCPNTASQNIVLILAKLESLILMV